MPKTDLTWAEIMATPLPDDFYDIGRMREKRLNYARNTLRGAPDEDKTLYATAASKVAYDVIIGQSYSQYVASPSISIKFRAGHLLGQTIESFRASALYEFVLSDIILINLDVIDELDDETSIAELTPWEAEGLGGLPAKLLAIYTCCNHLAPFITSSKPDHIAQAVEIYLEFSIEFTDGMKNYLHSDFDQHARQMFNLMYGHHKRTAISISNYLLEEDFVTEPMAQRISKFCLHYLADVRIEENLPILRIDEWSIGTSLVISALNSCLSVDEGKSYSGLRKADILQFIEEASKIPINRAPDQEPGWEEYNLASKYFSLAEEAHLGQASIMFLLAAETYKSASRALQKVDTANDALVSRVVALNYLPNSCIQVEEINGALDESQAAFQDLESKGIDGNIRAFFSRMNLLIRSGRNEEALHQSASIIEQVRKDVAGSQFHSLRRLYAYLKLEENRALEYLAHEKRLDIFFRMLGLYRMICHDFPVSDDRARTKKHSFENRGQDISETLAFYQSVQAEALSARKRFDQAIAERLDWINGMTAEAVCAALPEGSVLVVPLVGSDGASALVLPKDGGVGGAQLVELPELSRGALGLLLGEAPGVAAGDVDARAAREGGACDGDTEDDDGHGRDDASAVQGARDTEVAEGGVGAARGKPDHGLETGGLPDTWFGFYAYSLGPKSDTMRKHYGLAEGEDVDLGRWHRDTAAAFDAVCDRLWDEFWAPIHTTLIEMGLTPDGSTEVVLMPPGQLSLLPIHAAARIVDSPDGPVRRHAIEDWAFSTSPGPQALVTAAERAAARRDGGPGGASPSLLSVFSNPVASANIDGGQERDPARPFFTPDAALHLSRPREATRAGLAAALPGRSHVCFFGHGVWEPADPMRSGLVLHRDPEGKDEARPGHGAGADRLTLGDLQRADLDLSESRLWVLGACETAPSYLGVPDEFLGLAAGLALQVPGVVSTLYPINALRFPDILQCLMALHLDPETGRERISPARALREVQVAALRGGQAGLEALLAREAGPRIAPPTPANPDLPRRPALQINLGYLPTSLAGSSALEDWHGEAVRPDAGHSADGTPGSRPNPDRAAATTEPDLADAMIRAPYAWAAYTVLGR